MNLESMSSESVFHLTPNSRICIVGAGPAGLSAACYLRDRGCSQITILEREAYPGGKCLSIDCGECLVELGAVFASDDYEATQELMRRVGIQPARSAKPKRPKVDKRLIEKGFYSMEHAFPGYFSYFEALKLFWQILKYSRLSKRYQRLHKPGLDGLQSELHDPFSSWVEKHGMSQFAKMIEIPCTTFGYGYFDEIPAAYVLKYMDVPFVLSLIFQKRLFHWKDGVQTLWKSLAACFDVRYQSPPRRIRREGRVFVETGSQRMEFDALILTGPLDESLSYLDTTEEEQALFSRIKTYDYYVYCLEVSDMPISKGFKPANFRKDRAGRMMIWSRRSSRQNLYAFYTLGGSSMTDPEIRENLREEIEDLGGSLLEVRAYKKWKYFPHVDPETIKTGFYERLENLQGKRRTFFAGEVMNFSTIEHSVRYSRHLVERFFRADGNGP
jgi:hypothetical protein